MPALEGMDALAFRFAVARRTATLATLGPDGRPRLVPICFVLAARDMGAGGPSAPAPDGPTAVVLYSPLDEKPKRDADVRKLARVRDILRRPEVTLLFDRWSEDWERLAWLRARGRATLLEPSGPEAGEHRAAVALLRDKYPQYGAQAIDRLPIIAVAIEAASAWGDLADATGGPGA